jgi:hypothetical protein
MSVYKNPLDQLVAQALLEGPKARQSWRYKISDLMNETDPKTLVGWISQITNPHALSIIGAAGVPGSAHRAWSEQSKRVGKG